MLWLFIALAGYLLYAFAQVIDKALITKSIPQPAVYTFFVTLLGAAVVVVAPFGHVQIPSALQMLVNMAVGITFALALFFFFAALKKLEATRATAIVGGLQPIIVLVVAAAFLGESLHVPQVGGVILLAFGTYLMARQNRKGKAQRLGYYYALASTVLFAATYVLSKYAFDHQPFLSALVWGRVWAFAVGLCFLLSPTVRQAMRTMRSKSKPSHGAWFIVAQVFGAVSFLLVNYAISLHSVTVVNALQGIQYAFIFVLTIAVTLLAPQILREDMRLPVIVQKTAGIVAIIAGLALVV